MNNNQNNNSNLPPMPSAETLWASWSVFLGVFGLVCNFFLPIQIWGLPGGLILGIVGIAFAFLSKKSKHFTQKAQLGLILSVISAVSGLMISLAIIFTMNLMESNTPMGNAAKQLMMDMMSPQTATSSNALRIPK